MKIFNSDCPHCGTRSVAFTIHIEVLFHEHHRYWDTFSVCGLCGRGVVATFQSHVPPTKEATQSLKLHEMAPQRPDNGPPAHTPEYAGEYFRQGRDSLLSRNWTAAAMMYRKTLESGLKSKFPHLTGTLSLIERIRKARDEGGLTPDLVEWADEIRLHGNAAAHEEEPFTEGDAKTMDQFTELVLIYLFTLPGKLQDARREA